MSKIWDYFKNLFHAAEQSSPQQPLIHEMIERSTEEKENYERWKKTLVCRRLCNWLNDQYAVYLVDPESIDEAIYFLETPSAKGFVIYFRDTQYSRQDCTCLFDLLKEKVLALPSRYHAYLSDTRSYTNGKWAENIQRHYLKPSIKDQFTTNQPLPQKFGNITIELMSRDEQIWNLKFSAVSYKGRQYGEVEAFSKLMSALSE